MYTARDGRRYTMTTAPNIGSTAKNRSDDYYTPLSVVRAVHHFFDGPPDLDPASCEQANRQVQAARFYTKAQDGLQQDWTCGTLWMNPSFSLKLPFLRRLEEAYRYGDVGEALALVPPALETGWWQRYCAPRYWCAWRGRTRFLNSTGSSTVGNTLIYFGRCPERFSEVFGLYGLVYPPALNSGLKPVQSALRAVS